MSWKRHVVWACAIVTMCTGVITCARAGDLTLEACEAWLATARARAEALPNLGDRFLAWESADFTAALSADEDVGRVPRSTAPVLIRLELASAGDSAWRLNHTFVSAGGVLDVVYSPSASWQRAGQTLRIFDPAKRDDERDEQGTVGAIRSFFLDVTMLCGGGLGVGRLAKVVPGPAEIDGNSWKCQAAREVAGRRTYAVEFAGVWLPAEGRGRVTSMRVLTNTYVPADTGAVSTFSDWIWDAELVMELAGRVEKRRADGRLEHLVVLRGLHPLPPGGFSACLIAPINGRDAMRGEFAISQIADFQHRRVTNLATGESEPLGPPPEGHTERADRLRTWGYVSLACAVGLLVTIRLYRWKRTA